MTNSFFTAEVNEMARVVHGKVLYQQVADYVRNAILQGYYKKDDQIPSERELGETLNVSRVTVREGLKILAESGLIYSVQGKGSYVAVDNADIQASTEQLKFFRHVMESTQLRMLVEPSVAREVAENCPQDIRNAIGEHLDRPDEEPESFHRAIISALGNSLMSELFDNISEIETAPIGTKLVQPIYQEHHLRKLQDQHRSIFEAIQKGDGDGAYERMLSHLTYIKEIHDEYFSLFK